MVRAVSGKRAVSLMEIPTTAKPDIGLLALKKTIKAGDALGVHYRLTERAKPPVADRRQWSWRPVPDGAIEGLGRWRTLPGAMGRCLLLILPWRI